MRGNVASWKAVKIPLRLKNRERGKEWHDVYGFLRAAITKRDTLGGLEHQQCN